MTEREELVHANKQLVKALKQAADKIVFHACDDFHQEAIEQQAVFNDIAKGYERK